MKKNPFFLPALAALALTALSAHADSAYFIGNSVTDTIKYDGLQALAVARGHTQPWGRQMIPGAPLQWLWDHPTDGFTQAPYGYPSTALPGYEWDVLSLQPFDRSLDSDLDYSQRFIGLLYGEDTATTQQAANRIGARIIVFGRWPRQDDPARVGGPRGYDTLWLRTYSTSDFNSNESADFFSDLTLALRGASVSGVSLADRVFMAPVGHVMYELDQQMKAGQVAGYANIFEIYADGIHLDNVGAYVAACTYFAVIYRESPVGLPVPAQYGAIDPVLAARIQETVWNVVQTQPLSGVPSAGNLILSTLAVPPAYRDNPYSTTLLAVGGVAPRSFAVTEGALPAGVTLSADGQLSGTPTEAGDFAFTVMVTDSTTPTPLTASRACNLRVEVDTVPAITTPAALPPVPLGGRYERELAVSGGNGNLTWTLLSGTLPPGIQLGAGGLLFGSALMEGDSTFTLQVADGDSPPDTDTRTFTLAVGPPSPQTLLVAQTLSPVRVDGDLAETHWSLDHGAARALLGDPDNTTSFGALWDADNLYLAVRVLDTRLSHGTGTGAERDAVDLFLDAYNDKQAEFNSQHRQFRIALDGELFERGGRVSGVRHALLMVPGGYQIEISVPWTNLGITPVPDATFIGIDIANSDADTIAARQHYTAFAFSEPADPRPSQFGSAILRSTTVSGTGGEPLGASGPEPVAYEPFDYATGPLHDLGALPSFGFTGAWQVQNNNADLPGFAVEGEASLDYGSIASSGRYMTGGKSYLTAGRSLDASGAFLPWKRDGDAFIGKPGTSLWISYLARPLKATAAMKFSLDDATAVYHDNNGILRVQQSGGVWRLSLLNNTVLAPTSVPVAANATYLIVLRIDFDTTHTASLYVNPALGSDSPATPSATASTDSAGFRFHEFQLYPGTADGDGCFDEIRFGATWESVVPIPAEPPYPVTYSPLPGAYAGTVNVTLASATPGAAIHYTTDGTMPDAESPAYTAPLSVSADTTLRAVAIMDGRNAAASGAIYTVLTAFETWAEGIDWPAPASETGAQEADADRDGLSNFLEFALGGDPLDPASAPRPGVRLSSARAQLIFHRARSELTYTVEASGDLSLWSPIAVNPGTVGLDVTVTDTVDLSPGDPSRFLRLQISQ
ncbi:MAG: sugar-binding protein [Oceanipulchritudo sp.]